MSIFAQWNRLQIAIFIKELPRDTVLLHSFPFHTVASGRFILRDISFSPRKGDSLLNRDIMGRLFPSLFGNCFLCAELRLLALAFYKYYIHCIKKYHVAHSFNASGPPLCF